MNYPQTITGSPVYLCIWDGDIIELHTGQTLRKYKDLFDGNDGWGWELAELWTFETLLNRLEESARYKGRTFSNENMEITRLL